jgi:hypothetical protein
MPRCSSCHSEIPGFQTLCQKCYDTEYARISHRRGPKTLRERLTRRSALFAVFIYAYAFVVFRTAEFHLNTHPMPTKTAALSALLFASFAFYLKSS